MFDTESFQIDTKFCCVKSEGITQAVVLAVLLIFTTVQFVAADAGTAERRLRAIITEAVAARAVSLFEEM